MAFAFANVPSLDTSVSESLQERLRCLRANNLPRNSGILPVKLFFDRSSSSKPLEVFRDPGIGASNLFPSKCRRSKLQQVPRYLEFHLAFCSLVHPTPHDFVSYYL
jgi:hypothetical protein